MKSWKFNSGYVFSIEQAGKRIILCVFKNDILLVCRREYLSQVKKSLEDPGIGRLFAGRLKLFKIDEQVDVESQGEIIGSILLDEFKRDVDVLILAQKEAQAEIQIQPGR